MAVSSSQMLPDDVLADIFSHRLAPRSLAVSRSVCKAWRELVDGRRLLRSDLLPLSMAGIFINYNNHHSAELFSRPCSAFNYWMPSSSVMNHCNGLLLFYRSVLNPATGQRVPLPRPPDPGTGMERFYNDLYLVFDPFISLHYEVFSIPRVPNKDEPYDAKNIRRYGTYGTYNLERRLHPILLRSEWPPSSWVLDVFSSVTGRWEKRSFERAGQAAGTVASMQQGPRWIRRLSVYWKGALHVHCENDFVMRISLSSSTYQVIKPPRGLCEHSELHLCKSEKGVYFALLEANRLQVWILEESRGQMEWVSKHDTGGRGLLAASLNCVQQADGPWILLDTNSGQGDNKKEELVDSNSEWNSDDDSGIRIEDSGENCENGYMDILGFHPFKEIVFLGRSLTRGLAYHLNSSRIEDLGYLCPKDYDINQHSYIGTCFPYTPCRIGEYPERMK